MARSYWLFDCRLTVLADAEATGGRYDLIEGSSRPGARRPCTGTTAIRSSCMA
jgi:hypothetical protein